MNFKFLIPTIILSVGMLASATETQRITLFDAAKNGVGEIKNSTATWIKKGNLTPITKKNKLNGEWWINYKFEGSNGIARSYICTAKRAVEQLKASGHSIVGIELKINYAVADSKPIEVCLSDGDGGMLMGTLLLQKEKQLYTVRTGYNRENKFKWNNLAGVYFWLRSSNVGKTGAPQFRLQSIVLLGEKQRSSKVQCSITRIKKIVEILPLSLKNESDLSTLYSDLKRRGSKIELRGNKKQQNVVYLAYSSRELFIVEHAYFPTPPQSGITKRDDTVFDDEALQLFFSAERDNTGKIQFVINRSGTIWDCIWEFDLANGGVIAKLVRDITARQHIVYGDKTLTTALAFPLTALKIDLKKSRLLGFNVVRNYNKRKILKNSIWSNTEKYIDPFSFGVVVFNKQLFGAGKAKITNIRAGDTADTSRVNYMVDFDLKNMIRGNYIVQAEIIAADGSKFVSQKRHITINKSSGSYSAMVANVLCLTGQYTAYLKIFNTADDILAAGCNFSNTATIHDLYGKNFLFPTPKKVVWQKNKFNLGKAGQIVISHNASKRTQKTAMILKNMISDYSSGADYQVSNGSIYGSIKLKIAKNVTAFNKRVKLKDQGYHLKITSKAVTITGADEAGLFNGCISFIQILKMQMQLTVENSLRCAEILDWPDYKIRLLRLEASPSWGRPYKDSLNADFFINLIKKMVTFNKVNTVMWNFAVDYQFKSIPGVKGRLLTKADVLKVVRYCNDRMIEVIPAFNTGGHGQYSLGPDMLKKMRLKGYKHTIDTTHPEHDKIVFGCFDEMLKLTKSKYILIFGDEWWFRRMPGEAVPEKISGRTPAQTFLDFYIRANDFLKKRNVRPIIFEDMLVKEHNGWKFDNYKNIDKMPKDYIIAIWSKSSKTAEDRTQRFLDYGYTVWGSPTFYWYYKPGGVRKKITGYGPSLYRYAMPFFRRFNQNKFKMSVLPTMLYSIERGWNGFALADENEFEEMISGKLVEAAYMNSIPVNRSATTRVEPLNIKRFTNMSLATFIKRILPKMGQPLLKTGKQKIGTIPAQIAADIKNCIVVNNKIPTAKILINRKFSSLIFLHATHCYPKLTYQAAVKKFKSVMREARLWPAGYFTVNYNIHYTDGTQAVAGGRLFNNISLLNNSPLAAAVILDNRYTLPIKTSTGKTVYFYQWEWVNPYPAKMISYIEMKTNTNLLLDNILLALSGRAVR